MFWVDGIAGGIEWPGGPPNPYAFPEGARWIDADVPPDHPHRHHRRFEIVRAGPDEPFADKCRQLETLVFSEFFPSNTPELMVGEYGPYDGRSFFLGMIDSKTKELAGQIRVVYGDRPQDLKSIHDDAGRIEEALRVSSPDGITDERIAAFHPGFESQKTWEISTFVVAPHYRRKKFAKIFKVEALLLHSLYVYSARHGIRYWDMIMDEHITNNISQRYGVPLRPFCGLDQPREYLDSAVSYHNTLDLAAIPEALRQKSRALDLVFRRGIGLSALCNTEEVRQ